MAFSMKAAAGMGAAVRPSSAKAKCVSKIMPACVPLLVRVPCQRAMPPRQPSRQLAMITQASAKTLKTSTVKIIIQGRKLLVTDAIKSYVESKISKALANFGQEVKEVDVTLSARGGDTGTHGKKEQKVDVTVYTLRNGVIRVEDCEETLYASIDVVCDKLVRKMGRIKEKAIVKGKWPGRAGPKGGAEDVEFQEFKDEVAYETAVFDKDQALNQQFAALNKAFPATVRRTKVVELDPISADEAIEAMEAVGHDFYVYRDLETDEVQVVYKRDTEEPSYGVLVPKKRD